MRKLLGILAVLAIFLTTLNGVKADVNWNHTLTDSLGVTGSTQNLTIGLGPDNIVNVTFHYVYANGSSVFIAEDLNDTDGQKNFEVSWDTTTVVDQRIDLNATSYIATGTNDTTQSTATIGVNVDNSAPTSTYGTANPANNADLENNTVIFLTATDASLTNCTLTTSPGLNATGSSFTAIASSNYCELKVFDIPDGTYSYSWATRDNLNTSTLTTRFLTVSKVASNAVGNIAIAGAAAKKDTAIIVILAAAALFFVFKKK